MNMKQVGVQSAFSGEIKEYPHTCSEIMFLFKSFEVKEEELRCEILREVRAEILTLLKDFL